MLGTSDSGGNWSTDPSKPFFHVLPNPDNGEVYTDGLRPLQDEALSLVGSRPLSFDKSLWLPYYRGVDHGLFLGDYHQTRTKN